MVESTPGAVTSAERQLTSSKAASKRAPFLLFMTAYMALWLAIWFIAVIIIHSEPQASPNDSYYVQLDLAEMSLQLFMYCLLLTLASLSMAWYADLQRTKAARASAAMVGTFCKSVWLYTMWYSISTFYDSYNDLNWFCGGADPTTHQPKFPGVTATGSDWCHLARTVGVANVLIGAGLIAIWVWTIVNRFARIVPEVPIGTTVNVLPAHYKWGSNAANAAHNLDISWRTILTLPDDLEQAFMAAAHPALYGPMRSRMNFLSKIGTTVLVFISIGSLLLTYPSLSYSKSQGLNAWATASYVTNISNNYVGWGDPIIASNWYWLMLTLGVSLGLTSYADGRTHRSFAAAAGVVAALNALQFLSFWVYSARRINAGSGSFVTLSIIDSSHAQQAEVGGAGLIMFCQILLAFTMLVRYFTYLPILPEHHDQFHHPAHVNGPCEIMTVKDTTVDPNPMPNTNAAGYVGETKMYVPGPQRERGGRGEVPSYNLPALHGVGWALRVLIGVEVLLIFAWWILQVVQTSWSGVFDNVNDAQAYFFNERMFMLTSVLCTAALMAAVYAERHRDSGTATAAAAVCATMFAGFWLLVWPFAYQSVASDGALRTSACGGEFWCKAVKASGVFALMQAFILAFTLLSAAFTVLRVLAIDRGELAGGRRTSSLLSSALVWLLQLLVWVWAFATIAVTVRSDLTGFYQQWQTIEPADVVGASFTEGYWASQAFLLLCIVATASWMLCYGRTVFHWQSRPVRMVTLASCTVLAAATLPMLILACRFAQTLSMNADEKTLAAVFILLPFVALAIFALALWRFVEPLYRNPNPAIRGTSSTEASMTHGAVPSVKDGLSGGHATKLMSVVTVPASLHTEHSLTDRYE